MPKTLHQFLQLPWELREEIWTLATRSERPGAHVFTIYDIQKDEDANRSTDVIFDQAFRCGEAKLQLSAPKSLPGPDATTFDYDLRQRTMASWACNNHSAYLIDGGLWTACKESRMIMERRFPDKASRAGTAAATSYFIGQDLGLHYFTILPHRDLVVLQPFCIYNIDLESINRNIPIGSTYARFGGIKNIAIEYDPSWGQEIAEFGNKPVHTIPIIKYFLNAIMDIIQIENIWFIDYGIKRTQNVRNRNDWCSSGVFYMDDRKFVSCDTDLDWRWDDSDAYVDLKQSGRYFYEFLDGEIESMFDDLERAGIDERSLQTHIGLLACEYI